MSSDHATTNYQVFSTLRRPKKKNGSFFFFNCTTHRDANENCRFARGNKPKKKKQTDSFAATTIDDILT